MPDNYFVDLHCHPNIKAFNSGHPNPTRNMWENIPHPDTTSPFMRLIRMNTRTILKESQSNMDNLVAGRVRVANVSIYPIEKGFLRMRNLPNFLAGVNRTEKMIEHITGINMTRINHMKKAPNEYFHDLVREYEYVRDGQGPSPDGTASYEIVNNYKELEAALKKPNNVAAIMSIEGGHSLGCGNDVTKKMSKEDLKQQLTDNIRAMKQWEHPPFTINLAHHFYNQLCGQSASFKRPIRNILNQNLGKNKGMTELGRHVVRELLSRENGKRVIIDTKHMSIEARKEYYEFLKNYNYLNPKDKIPIVCSHGGVNGYKDMATSAKMRDVQRKSRHSVFHQWSINVSDEEIRIIHDSEGLVGIMMDKGMLGGIKYVNKISSLKNIEQQRHEFCELIWLNIFQAVKAVGEKTGWDVVAFGSDYDGIINHIDPYQSAASVPLLRDDLVAYLHKKQLHQNLWYGYTPEELVDKVLRKNAMDFYKKFFV